MNLVRRHWLATSLLVLLAGAPGASRAATAPAAGATDASARTALVAERQRLRDELGRVNAEIDKLKRADRGMRDDYRLRARLADAEALARRLTELDARLGRGPVMERPAAGAEPRALPSDGPAELEAKADILSDQANRLASRAETILGRARDLRARQDLRRHVGQMERDPFSPLEGSKRRAMAAGATFAPPPKGPATPVTAPTTGGNGSMPTSVTDNNPAPGVAQQAGGGNPVVAMGTGPPGTGSAMPTAPGTNVSTPTNPTGNGSAVTAPHSTPSPSLGTADGAPLSAQLRDLLDPTTLAEIQRLEASGGAMSNFEALERAGAALKARAARLAQQAASLRASERVAPRAR